MTAERPGVRALLGRRRRTKAALDATPRRDGRPRVLYLIARYPNFSETYMHEEIRSLIDRYDIKIITYGVSPHPRRDPFPYEVVRYKDSDLVYGPISRVNRDFDSRAQKAFLKKVDAIIDAFAPDVMHAHYIGLGLLLEQLAERHKIPFTIRTHSMDMLSEPPEKIAALCEAANSPWCLRLLVFPAFRDRVVAAGVADEKVVSCWPAVNFARFYRPERRPPTNRVLCAGPAVRKKAHQEFVDLAAKMRGSGLEFHLYAKGMALEDVRAGNEQAGGVVNITYADPDDMPEVYPRFDWLVYPSDTKINKVGFPVAIAEAQAGGLGVCWQELPGRREEQLEFLGGAGFLFRSIDEVPATARTRRRCAFGGWTTHRRATSSSTRGSSRPRGRTRRAGRPRWPDRSADGQEVRARQVPHVVVAHERPATILERPLGHRRELRPFRGVVGTLQHVPGVEDHPAVAGCYHDPRIVLGCQTLEQPANAPAKGGQALAAR